MSYVKLDTKEREKHLHRLASQREQARLIKQQVRIIRDADGKSTRRRRPKPLEGLFKKKTNKHTILESERNPEEWRLVLIFLFCFVFKNKADVHNCSN